MIAYLIQASLGLLLFYALYYVWLRKETDFSFTRAYLLMSLGISIIIPFISWDILFNNVTGREVLISEYWLPDIQITTSPDSIKSTSSWLSFTNVYWMGLIAFTISTLTSIFYLRNSLSQSEWKCLNGISYKQHKGNGSFSFFNTICIGLKDCESDSDRLNILKHEQIHIKLWHSLDVMLLQLLIIAFWFNPIIYLYKRTLMQLHEFEADSRAAEDSDADLYCNLLARVALTSGGFKLANHFNTSLTVKRIAMIKKVKRKLPSPKRWALVAATIALIALIGCEDKMVSDMKKMAKNSMLVTEYPGPVQEAINKIKQQRPDAKPRVYLVDPKDDKSFDELLKKEKKTPVVFVTNGDKQEAYVILGAEQANVLGDMSKEGPIGDEVFTIVEDIPSPKDGMEEFYKYIGQNLRYPEQARKMGIEGRVFVRFMVDKEGKLSNFEVLKGIGAGCDTEAIRVLSASPAWNPGKQGGVAVNSIFNLAIAFKLGEKPTGK